jgi:hypothetical protein
MSDRLAEIEKRQAQDVYKAVMREDIAWLLARMKVLEAALNQLGEVLASKSFPLTPHDTAEPCVTLCDVQDVCREFVRAAATGDGQK